VGRDCQPGDACLGGTCALPTCADGIEDGTETDVDCGGASCPACTPGRGCTASTDCVDKVCTAGRCQAANCTDGVKNDRETDVDCGGPLCGPCALGQACLQDTDCSAVPCAGHQCGIGGGAD